MNFENIETETLLGKNQTQEKNMRKLPKLKFNNEDMA